MLILVTGAHQFAADWVARVQGTLILYAATGDCTPFERAMASLLELAKENRRRKRRDPKCCWCPGALRRSLQGVRHQFTTAGDHPVGPLCNALPSCCAWSVGRTPGLRRRRVQILYKGPEIPANTVIPEFALSVTYRKYQKAENPGSIPVGDEPPNRA